MRPRRRRARGYGLAGLLAALTGMLWLAGCAAGAHTPPAEVPDGNPAMGELAIEHYGCGTCHAIPGVRGADGTVGPPLDRFGRRGYIAGRLPNNGPNLIRWIQHPQQVEPGTAMPDQGVSDIDARNIAAYLFTLE
jgi:cytochrome c